MPGEESEYSPEKEASCGCDHSPATRCDSTIALQAAVLRVKNSVLPSGANVGEPSFAGPEITPGENSSGATAALLGALLCWRGVAEPFRACKDGSKSERPIAKQLLYAGMWLQKMRANMQRSHCYNGSD